MKRTLPPAELEATRIATMTCAVLNLAGITIDATTVAGWSDEEKAQARNYAASVYLREQGNDVSLPEVPAVLQQQEVTSA